jgi:hypothetical protein
VSRAKIREFLAVWFGVPLSVGTLDRCIREVGVACEPVVEDLLGDLRQAGVIHADETPWKQHGRLRWLVLSSTTAIFHIGSRQGDEIRDLIGDAFLGWLVSDGYGAHRKFKKRQRCLAHLIRKGIALAGGLNPQGAHFGAWLLREVRDLIHEVAEGTGARIVNPILARLKRACRRHRDDEAEKVRALAREVLNDWAAITAFVTNPDLPATNNEAERALRDAVIARRISHGTRTEEGSAAYAATMSVFGPSGNAAGGKPAAAAVSNRGATSPTCWQGRAKGCPTSLSRFQLTRGGERIPFSRPLKDDCGSAEVY